MIFFTNPFKGIFSIRQEGKSWISLIGLRKKSGMSSVVHWNSQGLHFFAFWQISSFSFLIIDHRFLWNHLKKKKKIALICAAKKTEDFVKRSINKIANRSSKHSWISSNGHGKIHKFHQEVTEIMVNFFKRPRGKNRAFHLTVAEIIVNFVEQVQKLILNFVEEILNLIANFIERVQKLITNSV